MTIANSRWPERPFESFQITRLMGIADFGGADFTEVYETSNRIDPKDGESWHREWLTTAEAVEELGQEAEAAGNWLTARNAYQRACNYYRAAQFLVPPVTEEKIRLLEKLEELFQRAARYFDPAPERIAITYEGQKLPGYFFPALGNRDKRAPTLFYLNGGDSLSTEAYFTLGRTFIEAGYNFFVYDQPGVGLTLNKLMLGTRADAEVFVSPAVDYLLTRPDVDPKGIVLAGESLAGILIPRAIAFEHRLAAAVAYSPLYALEFAKPYAVASPGFQKHFLHLFGAKNIEEMLTGSNPRFTYSLKGVLDKIKCPLLLVQGTEDTTLLDHTLNDMQRIYEEAGTKSKKMVIIEMTRMGGTQHCQKDNLHLAQAHTLNWLYSLGVAPTPPKWASETPVTA
ncbi:MAG: alpha/beta hydrolase [Candidatus Limnocylindrales bacterium]